MTAIAQEHPVARLMRYSRETQVPWIIQGLWQEGGIFIVHSLEEEFKSIFSYQVSDAIASAAPLLRVWKVPRLRRVGILETEMDDLETGNRLRKMYPRENYPDGLVVSEESLIKEFRRRQTLGEKFDCIEKWMKTYDIEILVWDTINSILAVGEPNSEVGVSKFFDKLALLPHKGALLIRHDCKPSKENESRNSNQRVRGSNRLVEDASLVIHLHRQDKAKNKVCLTVGKLRNGRKPDPMQLWFDVEPFQLTMLPPVAAMLETGAKTRAQLIQAGEARFGLKVRCIDQGISELRAGNLVLDSMIGHKSVLRLNPRAVPDVNSEAAKWWSVLKGPEALGGEMQPCISTEGVSEEDSVMLPESSLIACQK
jgi:hypothetical protein